VKTAPIFTSWLVNCHSLDQAEALRSRLSKDIRLDAVVEDVIRSYQGGVEHRQIKTHRLGDYFAEIRLLSSPGSGPTALRLVFQRLPRAGRYWKDLMVNIIQALASAPETVSVTLDYKVDKAPLETAQAADD